LKAPSFAYARAKSLAEAFELIERPGAKVLAVGQSLIASLNMRLAHPDLLVDINALGDLKGIELRPAGLRIGALATHAQIEKSELVAKHAPLLAQAVKHVAHPAIRNRGTIGGSLALADPAAEYPACALALNATIVLANRRGERRVSAEHFFKGLFDTDIRPGDLARGCAEGAGEGPAAARRSLSLLENQDAPGQGAALARMEHALETTLTVNGQRITRRIEPRQHLVDFLREELGLTGSHIGCEHGVCGACTLRVNGEIVRGCLMLAVQADGCTVETIEGLTDSKELAPLQKAFHEHNALQCGFCTPGMLLAAQELVRAGKKCSREEIREHISGNYCRCTGYQAIVDAIEEVMQAETHG
jgi:carbon-monoxide dehydrogenase small subunit